MTAAVSYHFSLGGVSTVPLLLWPPVFAFSLDFVSTHGRWVADGCAGNDMPNLLSSPLTGAEELEPS